MRAITDVQGKTLVAYDYTAFGAVRREGGSSGRNSQIRENAWRYAGEHADAQTGLHYHRARNYDPSIGRFTQADPLGAAGGPNLYTYADNNPATLTDPTGLCPWCVALGAAWAVAEFALAAYDTYDTARTLLDPDVSAGEKVITSGLFAAGLIGPGGGYGAAGRATKHRFLSVAYEVDIDDIRHASRDRHKTRASSVLQQSLRSDATFRSSMEEVIPDIYGAAASRGNPQGWRWHHAIREGKMYMQLVPAVQHDRGPLLKRIHRGGKGGFAHRYDP